ncbi:hypothetical protein L5515_001842 [Caenorhabditis briggsae]|uniref:Uncharacterized protein n=1 Tax=Caenorhabditis briggsae TaxID=6238 RepID=A0AAE9J426_CAEBR|nr:hypothetical protein L3Y34_015772 [Caenorhabditis briggsae]UMM13697.1 hypothetical protein L5515_001842 [Caenorhabditis briggsae]
MGRINAKRVLLLLLLLFFSLLLDQLSVLAYLFRVEIFGMLTDSERKSRYKMTRTMDRLGDCGWTKRSTRRGVEDMTSSGIESGDMVCEKNMLRSEGIWDSQH